MDVLDEVFVSENFFAEIVEGTLTEFSVYVSLVREGGRPRKYRHLSLE